MNNPAMYELENAGGIPYPETDKYHYSRWYTTTGLTDGSAYKTIRFNVRQDNLLLHWRNSYLELSGKVVRNDNGNPFANNANISLIHNAIPHMFSNVKLTVGNQLVENINHVGHVSSLIYDVIYPRSKGKCDGLQFMWFPDTIDAADVATNKGFKVRRQYIIDTPATNGTFKLRLPMHMLFGFMENFTVLKGYPIEIELVRGPDYPSLYRKADGDNPATEGKLVFKDIILNIPIVEPSTTLTINYLSAMKDSESYHYSFRERHGMFAPVPENIVDFHQPITSSFFTERPQMIWVGFQQSNVRDQTFNHALYKNENVESAYIQMNNSQFPSTKFNADWGENDNGFFYEMQQHVRVNYLQHSATYTEGNMITPANFKDLYAIYCFDVSKQDMTLGSNNITCDLHIHFKVATGANLRVYIAWFNDRTLEMFSDGKPINIRKDIESYE